MKKLYPVLFLIALFVRTNGQVKIEDHAGSNSIVHLKYTIGFDIPLSRPMELYSIRDTVFLSYKDHKLVLKLPVRIFNSTLIKTDSGDVFLEDSLPYGVKYNYLVIDTRDSSGLFYSYRSLLSPPAHVNGDSAFKRHVNIMPNIIDPNFDSLVQLKQSNGRRQELYFTTYKPDASYPDSTVLVFSKSLTWIPFSFSRALDKSRGMKLCTVRFITNASVDPSTRKNLPRRELKFDVEMVDNAKDSFLLELLK